MTTMSGHPARLWATKTQLNQTFHRKFKLIPFNRFGRPRGVIVGEEIGTELVEVGAELYILPTYMGNGLVTVEVIPVISAMDGQGRKRSYRVQKLSTKVTGYDGRRIYLGGASKSMNEFFSSIFQPIGGGKTNYSEFLDIHLTPHVKELRPPANRSVPERR